MNKITGSVLAIVTGFILGFIVFIHGPVGLLRVTSGSMEPTLRVGEVCFVDKIRDFSDLNVGEIVVFYYGNQNKACHRIIEKKENGYITKGDANTSPDIFLLTENNYYGRVAFSI